MYSMVLMMALSGSADVPDFGRRGCHGCRGGCYSSCGCSGGGWCGGGCWGGGGGWGGGGCWGGYGCCGGGWAGYGGWGGGGYAYGGYGMPYGSAYAMPYGTMMPYGSAPYQAGYYNPDTGQYEPTDRTRDNDTNRRDKEGDRRERVPTPRSGGGVMGPAPARLIVHLPEDARLRIDGEPTDSTSDTRVFVSPPLEPGKTYHYQLQAQLDRKGENEKTSRTVEVQAGRDTEVYLDLPARQARNR